MINNRGYFKRYRLTKCKALVEKEKHKIMILCEIDKSNSFQKFSHFNLLII